MAPSGGKEFGCSICFVDIIASFLKLDNFGEEATDKVKTALLPSSVQDVKENNVHELKVYPNPANYIATVSFLLPAGS